ncbi:MAG TPA: flagellar basal body L-ring protein FlgH [Acetobacteraceae bacterium]|nr:flagellar basal body L-ring protein FlgH [Acetobacteraceae bacterium]
MRRAIPPAALAALLLLSGCGALTRLSEVGQPPNMTPTADPTADPKWRPVSMPMPNAEPPPTEADSLWRPGSRAFFKDQRAARVGDIITILVSMADNADLKNQSNAGVTNSEAMAVPNFFGIPLPKVIKNANPAALVTTNSNSTGGGTGEIKRNETVQLQLAGVISQVLANGNLVVLARQQIRVNSELRDLQVSGVIRPEDIDSNNTIQSNQIAEARISYGGRGQLTTVQTPRWGQQLLDILLPF